MVLSIPRATYKLFRVSSVSEEWETQVWSYGSNGREGMGARATHSTLRLACSVPASLRHSDRNKTVCERVKRLSTVA
jgi:hypothetical protein